MKTMKGSRSQALLAVLAAVSGSEAVTSVAFGPNGCVSLSMSSDNSCVITTSCDGVDLTGVEFAFNCEMKGPRIQRHSFGYGGFDAHEQFDTGVKCQRCAAPTPLSSVALSRVDTTSVVKAAAVVAVQHKLESSNAAAGEADVDKADKADNLVQSFGPGDCVQTYLSTTGTCIMRTNCASEDTKNYEFGLICGEKGGQRTRHLFGKDSFESEETFNTMIKCDECLALNDAGAEVGATTGEKVDQVDKLVDEVKGMNAGLEKMKTEVAAMTAKVFGTNGTDSSAKEEAKEEAPANKTEADKNTSLVAVYSKLRLRRQSQAVGTHITKQSDSKVVDNDADLFGDDDDDNDETAGTSTQQDDDEDGDSRDDRDGHEAGDADNTEDSADDGDSD